MDNFPSNSHNPVAPEPDEQPKANLKVVTGNVVRRKKPLSKRFGEMFLGGDAKSVGEYVIQDVLLPAFRDMLADAVTQGFERMIFGENRPGGNRRGPRPSAFGGGNSSVNYNRLSSPTRGEPPRSMSRRARTNHDFDEIVIQTRAEAEEVLEVLEANLEKYGTVSVKDFYELVGVNYHFTDEKWGWTNLRDARVIRASGGYLLDMPRTEPLD